MTITFTLTVPTEPTRAAQPARGPWASALVERVKILTARTIGLPEVLPGKDGWDL